MKRLLAILLLALILSSYSIVLAEEVPPMPHLDSFAIMTTRHDDAVMEVLLSKPVDKLYVNWFFDMELVELNVNENLRAFTPIMGRDYLKQRLFVTLQQEHWIVIYERNGEIANVFYTKTGDIQSIRDIAFRKNDLWWDWDSELSF